MDDLRTCPYCGGIAHLVKTRGTEMFHASCTSCLARTGNATTRQQAAHLWNRRDDRNAVKDVDELVRSTVW